MNRSFHLKKKLFGRAHLSFSGYLVSVDGYMNLQLANAEEYIDGRHTGDVGEVLIRLFIFSSKLLWLSSRLSFCDLFVIVIR